MTDPVKIITADELVKYVGAGSVADDRTELLVQLVNAAVTDQWPGAANHQEGADVPVKVRAIALEVGARPVRNPKGLSSWTRGLDVGTRTERLPDDSARAGVFVTEAEARVLAAVGGPTARPRRVGSIRTRPGW